MPTQSPPPDADKEIPMDALNTDFRPGNGDAAIASAAPRGPPPISVTIENVVRTFDEVEALAGVSLEIAPGELLALLGPSGSGKTTLLRTVAGLEFPEAGQVCFDGEDVTFTSAAARRVGFVFQQYALFKHMTVAKNVAFGLDVRKGKAKPPKAEIAKRVDELLKLIELEGL